MVERSNDQTADRLFAVNIANKRIQVPQEFREAFNAAMMAGPHELARRFRVICALGVTGHGKSTTCNTICGRTATPVFKVSALTESETDKLFGFMSRWRNLLSQNPYIIFDSPGIGDSRNIDTRNITEMVIGLKEIGYVHTFLIVLNS